MNDADKKKTTEADSDDVLSITEKEKAKELGGQDHKFRKNADDVSVGKVRESGRLDQLFRGDF